MSGHTKKNLIYSSTLIAIVILSATVAGSRLRSRPPAMALPGLFQRSKVDALGHTRGIVQVDLMRQIMADKARATPPALGPEGKDPHQVSSQDHPLLGRMAPALVLNDVRGNTCNLSTEVSSGPVVVVFYLGATCMACVTHLTELDVAMPRFRERGARVWAVSDDAPEFSLERIRNYGGFQFPLLSDPHHTASLAYGVWNAAAGGEKDGGQALHGTFIVDRAGLVSWAHVGDRPFTDIEALLSELDRLKNPSSHKQPMAPSH